MLCRKTLSYRQHQGPPFLCQKLSNSRKAQSSTDQALTARRCQVTTSRDWTLKPERPP